MRLIEHREVPLLFHTFQNLGSQVPRADAAVREAEAWVAARLDASLDARLDVNAPVAETRPNPP